MSRSEGTQHTETQHTSEDAAEADYSMRAPLHRRRTLSPDATAEPYTVTSY
jgi:hypothetical protein